MDAVSQPPPSKPSGLPRPPSKLPTKLPVLKTARTSFSASPTPVSEQLPATPSPATSLPSTPRLPKRTPSVSLNRQPQPAVKPVATSKSGTARPTSIVGPKHVAKPSIGSRVNSRPTPSKRPISTIKACVTADDNENHDRLSSLDSFRSASRQGSFDDPHLEALESVEPAPVSATTQQRRSSRPSLNERTIESLQSLPSTPSERRRSSFFNPPQSPMAPPPRPGSSLSRNGSNGSRPGTSDGSFSKPGSRPASPAKKAPTSAKPASRMTGKPSIGPINGNRRSISGGLTGKLQDVRTASQRSASPAKPSPRGLATGSTSKSSIGRKTIASSRPAKPRPALGDAFAPIEKKAVPAAASVPAAEGKRTVSNSSAALRQQIAAAKAAARKEKEKGAATTAVKRDSPLDLPTSGDPAFEYEMNADPFNQAPKDGKHVLRNRINNARMDGKLNIAAMGLKEIPEEVRKMYDSAAMEESKVNWAEVVDLTKLIAADNDFEMIDDAVFVDRSPEDFASDDQTEGNQFGGLELLDFHGNSLQALPMGLRRLERLTSLNVSRNKLDNAAFDVISQIPTLKELKLGHNNLTGNLPSSVCDLRNLETLDVQANRLLGLPEALRELVSLKVLNVSGNQLTALPMEALEQLPLTDLDASSNALIASLFPLGGPNGHRTLQSLNVSNNSLAALTFSETLDMPQLRSLNLTNNHMTALPSVGGWTELITLLVGDNKVADFPLGFTSLQKLRNANFTSNEIRILDPMICKMEGLESLILASNPLREKKFLTLSNAADIKRDLRSRLEAEELEADEAVPESPVTVIGAETGSSTSMWSLKPSGLLDLASKNLSDDLNDTLGSFLNTNEVKLMHLQNNRITCVPPSLWLAQDLKILDLSGNIMSADYLSDELLLPSLRELNLSKCRITSLEPLTSQLQAPNLQTLTVMANRLSGELPALRATYPRLTMLYANDNKIRSISVEALRGLQTVNLARNDIDGLPAEIGLLWDEGLRSLDVGSNAFRVPNYRILDKGTETTLRWLRDRIPVSADESARQGAVEGYVSELD